jgi:hypothetical protein
MKRRNAMARHTLDIYPVPKEKSPMYINEPWLIDQSLLDETFYKQDPFAQNDNIRVYIPLDINRAAILRRLEWVISRYVEANEDNETNFQMDVEAIIAQIEIYDQIWYVRNIPDSGKHSMRLKKLPDGCAEIFPFELIDSLEEEFLK